MSARKVVNLWVKSFEVEPPSVWGDNCLQRLGIHRTLVCSGPTHAATPICPEYILVNRNVQYNTPGWPGWLGWPGWILSSCSTCFPVVQGVSGRLVSIWWLVAGQFFLKGMNERYLAARRPMFDPPTDRPNLILFSNLAANCPNIKLGIKTLNHKSWNTPFPVFSSNLIFTRLYK